MSFLSRLFRRQIGRRGNDVVTFDEEKVVHTTPDGRQEVVRWDELLHINIVTTGEGPPGDDLSWVLTSSSSVCLVPSLAEGIKELLPRLQQLPGFDDKAVIRAMGSISDATFLCWRRGGGF